VHRQVFLTGRCVAQAGFEMYRQLLRRMDRRVRRIGRC
jgi:hypothetical protein